MKDSENREHCVQFCRITMGVSDDFWTPARLDEWSGIENNVIEVSTATASVTEYLGSVPPCRSHLVHLFKIEHGPKNACMVTYDWHMVFDNTFINCGGDAVARKISTEIEDAAAERPGWEMLNTLNPCGLTSPLQDPWTAEIYDAFKDSENYISDQKIFAESRKMGRLHPEQAAFIVHKWTGMRIVAFEKSLLDKLPYRTVNTKTGRVG